MMCSGSGFYPRGGGEVVVEASPISSLRSVELLDRGNVVQITGRSFVAGTLPVRVRQLAVLMPLPIHQMAPETLCFDVVYYLLSAYYQDVMSLICVHAAAVS